MNVSMPSTEVVLTLPDAPASIKGRPLLVARVCWGALALVTLLVFFWGAPLRHERLLSFDFFTELLLLALYASTGTVLFLHRSNERMALLTSGFLTVFGATVSPQMGALSQGATTLAAIVTALTVLGQVLLLLVLYLFPSGRFVPRWGGRLFVLLALSLLLLPPFGPLSVPDPFSFLAWSAFLLLGIGAQVYRYRRVSSTVERQQTKWVVFGIGCMLLGLLLAGLPRELFPTLFASGPRAPGLTLLSDGLAVGSLLMLPFAFAIAILRYRLWDIDILINRTLVYGALSATIVALYALIVGALGALLQARGTFVVSLIAAGVVAVLFQPVREWLQRRVNRWMFGLRDDPYAVISRLSDRLAATLASDAVLPLISQTVREALRLPYAAIELRDGGNRTFTRVASAGTKQGETLTFPLISQNETVGLLEVSPRAPNEPLAPRDYQLLQELARQVGAVLHAVLLTAELQQARIRLVNLREEERRRIRRDLHDGLGPVLASLVLQADAAHDLVASDPVQVQAILAEISSQSQAATAEVRRLVYGLRPPALDELGLIGALHLHIRRVVPSDFRLQLSAPETLPALPAAVEVACYRILQEAINNIVQHAAASSVQVTLAIKQGVWLTVEDDGHGIQPDQIAGVGLSSMRERTAELGGTLVIERGRGARGTRLRAFLPLPLEE